MLSKTYKGKIKIIYKDKRKPIVFKSFKEFGAYCKKEIAMQKVNRTVGNALRRL